MKGSEFFSKFSRIPWINMMIKVLVSLIILVVIVGLVGGLVKTFLDLRLLVNSSLDAGIKTMILNVLLMLAVVEVVRTATGYLSDGRVHVTYIVDTVLIVMLNEVIRFWFEGNYDHFMALISILLTLIIIRLLAIKFSPDQVASARKLEN